MPCRQSFFLSEAVESSLGTYSGLTWRLWCFLEGINRQLLPLCNAADSAEHLLAILYSRIDNPTNLDSNGISASVLARLEPLVFFHLTTSLDGNSFRFLRLDDLDE